MGLSVVTAAEAEVVSLDEIKTHLRVDLNVEDEMILGYVAAARSYLEEICNRAFLTSTWDYFVDYGWPVVDDPETKSCKLVIEIPKAPLVSVTSISYVDSNGAPQTLAGSQYAVDASGVVGRIYPAYGVTWPQVRYQPKAITVRFVAGYGAAHQVPTPIKQSIMLLAGHFYANREAVVVGTTAAELPFSVQHLIATYRCYP